MRRLQALFTLLLTLSPVSVASAQPSPDSVDATQALRDLQRATRGVLTRYTATPSDESLLAREIAASTQTIAARWTQADSPDLPADYVRALDANADALRTLLSDSAEVPLLTLRDVRDDLTLKAAFSSGDLGASGDFPTTVPVTVVTVMNQEEVSGYWVRCNPRMFGRTASPLYPFSSATSPTQHRLPPGHYVMWVEAPDGRVVAEQPVTIGLSGARSETITFSIPSQEAP